MILRKILKYFLIMLFIAAALFALWFWGAMKFAYSTGERAGYIQKFSKRGWVFKTWEGELAMVNLPGAMAEKFNFSVVDPVVADKLQAAMGNRLVLKYAQHRYIPLPVFAETEYFVTDVVPVKE